MSQMLKCWTCCRTRAQGMPVHERANACPQPLSLPTPGPREAYHDHYAEYRPIPGRGPADNPTSHWGEVVHAGNRQVDHDQGEHVPPVEEFAPLAMGWHALGAPTNLAHALRLCVHWLYDALHAARRPKGYRLHH